MAKYLDYDGLLYFWGKLKTLLGNKVDKVSGKGLSTNDYTTTEKNKLGGIATGAEVNQNAFSTAYVSGSRIDATSKTDGLSFRAGNNVSLSIPSDNDHAIEITSVGRRNFYGTCTTAAGTATKVVTISGTGFGLEVGTTISVKFSATNTATNAKLNVNETGAKPIYGQNAVRTAADAQYTGTANYIYTYVYDGTNWVFISRGYDANTTYSVATTSANGLMSSADKTKLDGIASGAEKNPGVATSSANGLMSSTDKSKLDGFGAASTYALKTDLTSLYKYKGSVATVSALPSSGQVTGDVYNVESTGMNYAWNGSAWDALGESFSITSITNGEIDTVVAT